MMSLSRRRVSSAFCMAAIAVLASISRAREVEVPQDASAAAAIAQAEAWITAHPQDAAGLQTLARLHALAWAYGETIPLVGAGPLVGASRRDVLPRFAENSSVLVSRTAPRAPLWSSDNVGAGDHKDRPVTAEDAKHLSAAISAYRKAIELHKGNALNGGDALSELGLGWMLAQQGLYVRGLPAEYFGTRAPTDAEKAAWAKGIAELGDEHFAVREAAARSLLAAMPGCVRVLREVSSKDPEVTTQIDAILQGYYDLQALDDYRKAYDLRVKADLQGQPTYEIDSQISERAAAQILAVLTRHPDAARKGEVQNVQHAFDVLAQKRQSLMRMPQ